VTITDTEIFLFLLGILLFVILILGRANYVGSKDDERQAEKYWDLIQEYQTLLHRCDEFRNELAELEDSHQYAVEREKLAREALAIVWERWRLGMRPRTEHPPAVDEIVTWRPKVDSDRDPSLRVAADDDYSWYGL
jgi:hypothetical protein